MSTLVRQLAAELIGTFALVFAGTSAIVVDQSTGGAVGHIGVAITFGLIVFTMIAALGDVSGAHFNPAVSFGFWVARRIDRRTLVGFVFSQCAGAILASLLVRALFPGWESLGRTVPSGSPVQSLVLEILLTAALMFVILNVSTGAKEKGLTAGMAIGGIIALEALFAGPISGASMNPARSLAPALVAWQWPHLWIYLLAPPLGALDRRRRLPLRSRELLLRESRCPVPGDMKRVLFVCVENSNRSQMAEAFARLHGGDSIEAFSAGSKPSRKINPKAIEAMKERGYDLTHHGSKALSQVPEVEYDFVATMGCGDACPMVRAKWREDWAIPDPRDMEPQEFRKVRDLIEDKVKGVLAEILRQ